MSSLDSRIEELYQGPLETFTASRNALAKTLSGDVKKQVAALPKPLAIPWVVNQTYWHARKAYNTLLSTGKQLRTAQVGALQGRSTDIRAATDHHAKALADVVAEATKLAEAGGVKPQADELRRMFEAISTRQSLPAEHGRFVKPLEPAGFEALSGLSIVSSPRRIVDTSSQPSTKKEPDKQPPARSAAEIKAAAEEERRRARERAETEKQRKAAIEQAEAKVAEATQAERRAQFAWERSKKDVEAAERTLAEVRGR